MDCDRTTPSCLKCVARGIKCSGLGIRYRFREDVKGGVENDICRGQEYYATASEAVERHERGNSISMSPSEVMEPWELYCLSYCKSVSDRLSLANLLNLDIHCIGAGCSE